MEWIRGIVCYICVFQLFLHAIPGETYKKYVSFFGSLLLLLMVCEPLAGLTGILESFEQDVRLFGVREEAEELEQNLEGISELKSRVIDEAFYSEVTRQMEEVAGAYGMTEVTAEVSFRKGEDGTASISGVEIRGKGNVEYVRDVKKEISSVYQVEESRITVRILE